MDHLMNFELIFQIIIGILKFWVSNALGPWNIFTKIFSFLCALDSASHRTQTNTRTGRAELSFISIVTAFVILKKFMYFFGIFFYVFRRGNKNSNKKNNTSWIPIFQYVNNWISIKNDRCFWWSPAKCISINRNLK